MARRRVDFLKFDFGMYILIFLLLVSSWYLFSPFVFKESGVVVISIDKNNKCSDIRVGSYITRAGGRDIKNKEDFESVVVNVGGGDRITMVVDWGPGGCTAIEDGNIGIEVGDAPSKSIKFGLEIYGGKKVFLKINKEEGYPVSGELDSDLLEDIKYIIERRAGVIGTSQLKVDINEDGLFVETLNVNDLPLLLSRGFLEGRIEERLKLLNGVGQIKVETEYYDVKISNGFDGAQNQSLNLTNAVVFFEGVEYKQGESFVIADISFKIINITDDTLIVSGLIFNNKDVGVATGASSYIRYDNERRRYEFFVPLELSPSAGSAFSKITIGLPSSYVGGANILEGVLVFYVDGEEINRLNIPNTIAGQNINSLSLVGIGTDANDALTKKKMVEAALVGSIEYEILIEKITEYEGSMSWLLYSTVMVVFTVVCISFILPIFVYKVEGSLKLSLLSSFLILSTVFSVFGVAATTQSVFTPGWILDSSSIFGILIVTVWLLVSVVLTSEKILKRKTVKIKKYVDVILCFCSFILVFTQFSGFGLAIIVGMVLNWAVVSPLYKKALSH